MEALFGLPGAAMAQQQSQSSTKKNVAKDAARSITRDQRGLDRGALPGTPMPPAHTSHVAARRDQGALPGTHTPLAHTRRAIHAARWRATEIQRLKREEVRLCALIKDTAKKPGGEAAARPLAKQLISLREQQARMSKASTAMSGVASQVRTAGATASAAQSIVGATKAMGAVNKAFNPARMQQTMQDFEKQSTLMSMQQEMVDDVFEGLDAEWADDDDEVLAQVMDEIGLDVASQMSSAPRGGGQSGAVTSTVGEVTGTAGEAPSASVQAM